MPTEYKSGKLYDYLFDFQAGVNEGIAPLLLPKNQMSEAINVTVRGTFATHRPSFRKIPISFVGSIQTAFEGGKWQGGGYYKPDNGTEKLTAMISGRFYTATPSATTAIVAEPPLNAAPPTTYPMSSTARQCWMWQSEKWMLVNDGLNNPLFYNGTDISQSTYGIPGTGSDRNTAGFTIPAVGITVTVTFNDVTGLAIGDIVTLVNRGTFQVIDIGNPNPTDVILLNINATPVGMFIAISATDNLSWQTSNYQLPPGRMGTYGMGRNWISLVDGKQFVASDLVGGSSGTVAENYRDAVLNITENLYLAGGGNFTVPGSVGDIKAMRFVATLDASLGQGPLQVLTPNTVFSCNAPVDRLTWQDVTNPILTESLISNGGLSQNATVLANGDLLFRSIDGLRSLVLARRDFNTWGNVPQSLEVDPILRQDSASLLEFSSAVVFDNRLLLTTKPVLTEAGFTYWKGLVALNFDPISSLRGKLSSVYDGLWTGLNILQIITGEFSGMQRCFAFTYNTITETIELYEILTDDAAYYDNNVQRITWRVASPVLDFGQKDPRKRELLRLHDGELYVDNMLGIVDFQVYYRPDQWPCWVPWHAWSECAQAPDPAKPETANYQPQFRPMMGLGEPSPVPCDTTNDRPMREGYSFQVMVVVTGHCTITGARFETVTIPQPMFSKQTCCFYAPPVVVPTGGGNPNLPPATIQLYRLDAITENDGTVAPITIAPDPSSTVVGLYGIIHKSCCVKPHSKQVIR